MARVSAEWAERVGLAKTQSMHSLTLTRAGAWYAHLALVAKADFRDRNALEFASRELFNAAKARPLSVSD